MKKTKLLVLASVLVAVLSVGTADAAPSNHRMGHHQPTHVVTVVQNNHHGHHHHVKPTHHHHHHHHHHNAGNIFLATAILISAFM